MIPETCQTCTHGVDDEKVEHVAWCGKSGGAYNTTLPLPQPFRCNDYRRASADACGCDRGVRYVCEAHRGGV